MLAPGIAFSMNVLMFGGPATVPKPPTHSPSPGEQRGVGAEVAGVEMAAVVEQQLLDFRLVLELLEALLERRGACA